MPIRPGRHAPAEDLLGPRQDHRWLRQSGGHPRRAPRLARAARRHQARNHAERRTIEIDANHRLVERRNDNVVETDFDIQVPAETRLDIKTFSAPVTVIGVDPSRLLERDRRFGVQRRRSAAVSSRTTGATATTSNVNTFSGDVTLRLPASARGDIDFDSFSGRFKSDLPVTLTSSSRRNFRGALNGGGNTDFHLKTFSGDVSISR